MEGALLKGQEITSASARQGAPNRPCADRGTRTEQCCLRLPPLPNRTQSFSFGTFRARHLKLREGRCAWKTIVAFPIGVYDHSAMDPIRGEDQAASTPDTTPGTPVSPVLEAILNLSRFHREHEKYYAQEPRAQAVTLQRHARALQALADRWSTTEPAAQRSMNPFEGSQDLNDPAALQLDGVLFMEREGEPPEIARLKRDFRTLAEDQEATGRWLAEAMKATWESATALLEFPGRTAW